MTRLTRRSLVQGGTALAATGALTGTSLGTNGAVEAGA
jgi:hypothetical protein